jgi:hypothetical protein
MRPDCNAGVSSPFCFRRLTVRVDTPNRWASSAEVIKSPRCSAASASRASATATSRNSRRVSASAASDLRLKPLKLFEEFALRALKGEGERSHAERVSSAIACASRCARSGVRGAWPLTISESREG